MKFIILMNDKETEVKVTDIKDLKKEIINSVSDRKPATPSMKITEAQDQILKGYKVGTESEMVTNPFSEESVLLCPEAIAMYDIIIGCQVTLENNYSDKVVEMFDAARDVFRQNWPKEYMILLD